MAEQLRSEGNFSKMKYFLLFNVQLFLIFFFFSGNIEIAVAALGIPRPGTAIDGAASILHMSMLNRGLKDTTLTRNLMTFH